MPEFRGQASQVPLSKELGKGGGGGGHCPGGSFQQEDTLTVQMGC